MSGSWTFLFPVGELYLTEAVRREFRVDRVTFVHKDKLPYVRKRLGLTAPVSEIKRTLRRWEFFETADAFAVVRQSGEQRDVENRCLTVVRQELSILSLSQLGYHSRSQMGPLVAPGEISRPHVTYLAVRGSDQFWFGNRLKITSPFVQVVANGRWKNYQDRLFFTKLLRILRGETQVDSEWREELRRASLMVGESVGANDLLKSFVWNMTALEMLITRQQQGKMLDVLPRMTEAFLGWILYWETEDYEGKIREVYRKRNNLVHQGKRDGITEGDLVFTDHLLLNLLSNLVRHPKLFGSKEDVIAFSKRLEAERILGLPPKVRPETFSFTRSINPGFS